MPRTAEGGCDGAMCVGDHPPIADELHDTGGLIAELSLIGARRYIFGSAKRKWSPYQYVEDNRGEGDLKPFDPSRTGFCPYWFLNAAGYINQPDLPSGTFADAERSARLALVSGDKLKAVVTNPRFFKKTPVSTADVLYQKILTRERGIVAIQGRKLYEELIAALTRGTHASAEFSDSCPLSSRPRPSTQAAAPPPVRPEPTPPPIPARPHQAPTVHHTGRHEDDIHLELEATRKRLQQLEKEHMEAKNRRLSLAAIPHTPSATPATAGGGGGAAQGGTAHDQHTIWYHLAQLRAIEAPEHLRRTNSQIANAIIEAENVGCPMKGGHDGGHERHETAAMRARHERAMREEEERRRKISDPVRAEDEEESLSKSMKKASVSGETGGEEEEEEVHEKLVQKVLDFTLYRPSNLLQTHSEDLSDEDERAAREDSLARMIGDSIKAFTAETSALSGKSSSMDVDLRAAYAIVVVALADWAFETYVSGETESLMLPVRSGQILRDVTDRAMAMIEDGKHGDAKRTRPFVDAGLGEIGRIARASGDLVTGMFTIFDAQKKADPTVLKRARMNVAKASEALVIGVRSLMALLVAMLEGRGAAERGLARIRESSRVSSPPSSSVGHGIGEPIMTVGSPLGAFDGGGAAAAASATSGPGGCINIVGPCTDALADGAQQPVGSLLVDIYNGVRSLAGYPPVFERVACGACLGDDRVRFFCCKPQIVQPSELWDACCNLFRKDPAQLCMTITCAKTPGSIMLNKPGCCPTRCDPPPPLAKISGSMEAGVYFEGLNMCSRPAGQVYQMVVPNGSPFEVDGKQKLLVDISLVRCEGDAMAIRGCGVLWIGCRRSSHVYQLRLCDGIRFYLCFTVCRGEVVDPCTGCVRTFTTYRLVKVQATYPQRCCYPRARPCAPACAPRPCIPACEPAPLLCYDQ